MRIHRVAQETRGNLLCLGRVGHQVTGKLLTYEFVVPKVAAKRMDHPVAPTPHVPMIIDRIAVGIGESRNVEPVLRQSFRKLGRLHQAINGRLKVWLSQKRIHFGQGWRQAGEIEIHASQQGLRCDRR